MLQDVIELRCRGWVPRRNDDNPKTIDQIRKEAARERAGKMLVQQNAKLERKSKHRDRGRSEHPPEQPSAPYSVDNIL